MQGSPARASLAFIVLAFMAVGGFACGSNTPLPTYTPAATYTPLPTYTPAPTYTPLPTYTPVPTATYTPFPTATPTPSVGTRENPAPFGTSMRLGNGWEMTVVAVIQNAASLVLEENRYNDPPQEGNQFYMATVRAKYLGDGSDKFTTTLKVVGKSAVIYAGGCGVIPNNLLSAPEVFTGGEISGNVCREIASVDAESLEMFFDPWRASERIWFALAPDA